MKATELIKELTSLVEEHGDADISISCQRQPIADKEESQHYISIPSFVIYERYDEGPEIMIRDWPY